MDLAHELHDLVRTLDKWAEKILRPEGLTYNQYVALVILSQHPGSTGRTLARSLGVTEAACSGIVKSLLAKDCITDRACTGSGNRRELHITPIGQATTGRCGQLLGRSLDDNARAIGLDPTGLATSVRALHDEVRTVRNPGGNTAPAP